MVLSSVCFLTTLAVAIQAIESVRGMNSPSESENPLKRIDENIEAISNGFELVSAISPEFDFRVERYLN